MAQPTITDFFAKRKRAPVFDKSKSKVLLLDKQHSSKPVDSDTWHKGEKDCLKGLSPKIVYVSGEDGQGHPGLVAHNLANVSKPRSRPRTPDIKSGKKTGLRLPVASSSRAKISKHRKSIETAEKLPDIRKTFLKQTVKFELKGGLSPKKIKPAPEPLSIAESNKSKPSTSARHILENASCSKISQHDSNEACIEDVKTACSLDIKEESKSTISIATNETTNSAPTTSSTGPKTGSVAQPSCSKTDLKRATTATAREELGLMAPKRNANANKELSLKEIKLRLSRSAKLAEMRESLAKINKGNEKLRDIEQRKAQLDAANPKLCKFKTIDVEVHSPMKACESPVKVASPIKGSPMKATTAPAYQRFSSLAMAGTPTLVLPFRHRCLAEVFRCVDTVVAMMHNRKEIVTFGKLKPAVQQMLRRNFTERHLGQIKRVLPSAFAFRQDKCHTFGSSSRADRYELTVTPLIDSLPAESDSEAPPMMPSTLLERRHEFNERLTERVKDAHEQFLSALDPPLVIARDRLTRWHPEFELEDVAEVEAEELPRPPNAEQFSTAKDVLAKAKNLFSCNERMEKALQTVAELSSRPAPSTHPRAAPAPPVSPVKPPSAALRGVPQALLAKVRAAQAARALLTMQRSADQDKQGVQHSRLPEMARIVRNLYVAERKGVLPLEVAVARIGNSYREKLSPADLEEHLQLLISSVPGWLEIHEIRKAKFLKLSKKGDMSKVMQKLEALALEKNGA